MGIFDGYLLCSDIDNTLAVGSVIPENNLTAIDYFTSEGGMFVISSGRFPDHLKTLNIGKQSLMISHNGTVIYDFESGRPIWKDPFDGFTLDAAGELPFSDPENCPNFTNVIYFEEPQTCHDSEELNNALHCGRNVYKTLNVYGDEASALRFKNRVLDRFGDLLTVERSWSVGVEIHTKTSGKGICIDKLKELYPEIKTVVAVGDYENDIQMLMHADINYAVENAVEELKTVADKVICNCREGAIDFIIKDLMK